MAHVGGQKGLLFGVGLDYLVITQQTPADNVWFLRTSTVMGSYSSPA